MFLSKDEMDVRSRIYTLPCLFHGKEHPLPTPMCSYEWPPTLMKVTKRGSTMPVGSLWWRFHHDVEWYGYGLMIPSLKSARQPERCGQPEWHCTPLVLSAPHVIGPGVIFQNDNSRPHMVRVVIDFLQHQQNGMVNIFAWSESCRTRVGQPGQPTKSQPSPSSWPHPAVPISVLVNVSFVNYFEQIYKYEVIPNLTHYKIHIKRANPLPTDFDTREKFKCWRFEIYSE